MNALTVGLRVAVIGSRGEVMFFTEVQRVLKCFVETTDGRRWGLHGRQYPRSRARFSVGMSIVPRTAEHDAEVEAADNRHHVRSALEVLQTRLRREEMDAATVKRLRKALAPFEVKP